MLKSLFVGILAVASLHLNAVGKAWGGVVSSNGPLQDAGLGVVPSTDGGPTYLGEAPGHVFIADDAGGDNQNQAVVDAGQPAAAPASSDRMQRLRDRLNALEQQLAQARAAAQTEQLQALNDQLADVRAQLAQDQALRGAREAARQEARFQTRQAVSALSGAERDLAFGNADVLGALDFAYPALPYPAQMAVESARSAIQSEDLGMARYWLSVAIAEAEGRQLGY